MLQIIDAGIWENLQNWSRNRDNSRIQEAIDGMDGFVFSDGGHLERLTLSEFNEFLVRFEAEQKNGIERGVPPLLISAMQKSGSVFVVYTLARILGVPGCSVGKHADVDDPAEHLMPVCLRTFAWGGAITHDHFRPTAHNLKTIREAGIGRVLVQMRDPRSAFVSLCHHYASMKYHPWKTMPVTFDEAREIAVDSFHQRFPLLLGHLDTWLTARASNSGIEIKFLWYEDLVQDYVGTFQDLLAFFGLQDHCGRVAAEVGGYRPEFGAYNFRKGETREWETFLTDEEKRTTGAMIDDLVARHPHSDWLGPLLGSR